MKTFDVYKHSVSGFQAVKQGFGWPAFFFFILWAWVKRMWGVGFLLLGVLAVLVILETAFEQSGRQGGVLLMLLAEFGLYVLTGVKGNDWRRGHIAKRGFQHVATVSAGTPEAAIGAAATRTEEILRSA